MNEAPERKSNQEDSDGSHSANPLFADSLTEWLAFRHPDNIVVGEDFNFDKRIKLNTEQMQYYIEEDIYSFR